MRYDYFPSQKTRRLKDNPEYRFKNILCDDCKKPFLESASRSKDGKKHPAYHCGGAPKGVRSHGYNRITKADFEASIAKFVGSLKFDTAFIESFEMVVNDAYRTREKKIVSHSSSISQNVAELKKERASAIEALIVTRSPIARKQIEEKINALQAQIDQAEGRRKEIEVAEKDIKSFIATQNT
jgi:hypothetical protein